MVVTLNRMFVTKLTTAGPEPEIDSASTKRNLVMYNRHTNVVRKIECTLPVIRSYCALQTLQQWCCVKPANGLYWNARDLKLKILTSMLKLYKITYHLICFQLALFFASK